MPTPTETHMPHLPGYYFDTNTNRYYKGTRPPPAPEPPNSTSTTTLPRLLRATALGLPTTTSTLHATLLKTATNHQITPTFNQHHVTPTPQHNAIVPTETFPYKPLTSSQIFVLAFPKVQLNHFEYASGDNSPIALASHGYNLAYAASDGVYVHEKRRNTILCRRYPLCMDTVSLSARHILMAGPETHMYKLSGCVIPPRPVKQLAVREVLCSDMLSPNNFALGTRDGRVVLADQTSFQPSGARCSVAAVKMKDNLVWCSTMRGEVGVSAWDVRCLSSPAITCRGQKNAYKMLGLDVSDTLVIAGSDDLHVRVWDVRGGEVLSRISVPDPVTRIKMAGWTSRADGTCGVWFGSGSQVSARVVST